MSKNSLKKYLETLGASLVGFADLRDIDVAARKNMDYGISFGIKLNTKIIREIEYGPTKEYWDEYKRINNALDQIAIACVSYIENLGYDAIGQTSTYVTSDDNLATLLPHKTVATRAGLGWIGKNALLITPEYGSAIRISSVLTNMPVETNSPINESRCGSCEKCSLSCPAKTIKGQLWNIKLKREELIDPFRCRQKARELSKKQVGYETSLCGKCIEVCPFTQRYISHY
ncbi:4Fe-4S double cluster binding domain-containing protein [Clostridium sp. UBA6640]|uniref:4Fe-4S double cluster binding domain-containing protein n=1 Tax=Clostridium sp. UBA6640 TaxID=1946370 RepID=UPI0025B973C4|nr:4Fe-4S double cluster binding domain-containing protein [Clostridium sp. UBA6640]